MCLVKGSSLDRCSGRVILTFYTHASRDTAWWEGLSSKAVDVDDADALDDDIFWGKLKSSNAPKLESCCCASGDDFLAASLTGLVVASGR